MEKGEIGGEGKLWGRETGRERERGGRQSCDRRRQSEGRGGGMRANGARKEQDKT